MTNKKSHIFWKDKRGATLIELLIYLAVIGVITGVFTSSVLLLSEVSKRGEMLAEINYFSQEYARAIAQTIESAEQIIYPAGGAASTTLLLKRGADNVGIGINDAGQLWINEPNDLLPLSDSLMIKDLSFINTGRNNQPENVYFTLTVSAKNDSTYDYSHRIETSVKLHR